ncbi:hypothetical protein VaNZ11_015606, partial [Volvox africanus]
VAVAGVAGAVDAALDLLLAAPDRKRHVLSDLADGGVLVLLTKDLSGGSDVICLWKRVMGIKDVNGRLTSSCICEVERIVCHPTTHHHLHPKVPIRPTTITVA